MKLMMKMKMNIWMKMEFKEKIKMIIKLNKVVMSAINTNYQIYRILKMNSKIQLLLMNFK